MGRYRIKILSIVQIKGYHQFCSPCQTEMTTEVELSCLANYSGTLQWRRKSEVEPQITENNCWTTYLFKLRPGKHRNTDEFKRHLIPFTHIETIIKKAFTCYDATKTTPFSVTIAFKDTMCMCNKIKVLCDIAGCILDPISPKVVCKGPVTNGQTLVHIVSFCRKQAWISELSRA